MDGSTINLADRIHRERTAALVREHEIRRSLADRGVVVTPARPDAVRPLGVGVWFRRVFHRPRRPRFI